MRSKLTIPIPKIHSIIKKLACREIVQETSLMMDTSRKDGTRKYQKKARDNGVPSLSITLDNSLLLPKRSAGLTPGNSAKSANGSFAFGDPGSGTPGRNTSSSNVLPQLGIKSRQKSPSRIGAAADGYADRFIPTRALTDVDRGFKMIMDAREKNLSDDTNKTGKTLRQIEYAECMAENLNDGQAPSSRVLSFKSRPPNLKYEKEEEKKILYSSSKTQTKTGQMRHIPTFPEKVLDAPELLDDYYLHLMDWSRNNHLAVSLGSLVFMWNASDGSITSLTQFDEPDHSTCLNFIAEGNILACGMNSGETQLWDIVAGKRMRTMEGHSGRVSALSWNSHILSSGSRTGQIIHHDVRIPKHLTMTFTAHTQEVCGLKWSPDGRFLASGGNDNDAHVWQKGSSKALHKFELHQAAVKALAWCPWQANLLATGGGTVDRTIRMWNCSTGTNVHTIKTGSQVSALLWNAHYKELVSAHGFEDNQLTLWKYPNFTKIIELTGHTGRILELCSSPDGQTVASAAADETLCLWNCWAVDKKEKASKTNRLQPISALTRTIR